MRLSLRVSLTAWFTGLASLVLGASSIALYVGVRTSLINGVDATLEAQANGVGALCEWDDGEVHLEGYYEIPGHQPLLEADHGFEVRLQPTGKVQVKKGLPLPAPREDHTLGAATYGELRVMAVAITFAPRLPQVMFHPEPGSPGFTVVVRTAMSLLPVQRQLASFRWFTLMTAVASIAGVVAFGMFLSRRVTRPLAQLGAAALQVRDGTATEIPRRGTGDEIDQLAALIDQAFAAVRGSVEKQRRFVADASHELRNPLAILASIAEIGQRRERTVGEHRDLLREIEEVARRMGGMLVSLLALARLDANGRMPGAIVDLADVARDVVDAALAAAPANVGIDLQVAQATVQGDGHLLTMMCGNLLSNALRHATTKVHVEVRVEGDRVQLRVTDDGPGMAEEERARVFERFFRGDNAQGSLGAGLGLALVRSVAQAHGGDCQLEPTAVGLAVLVWLPRTSR